MRIARISVRVPDELKERIDQHRFASGVPINTFIVRLLDSALPPGKTVKSTKPKRARAAS